MSELSPRDAFKVGFLARCVEHGLAPEQMLGQVEKASALLKDASVTGMLGMLGSKVLDIGHGVASGMMDYGVPIALAAPPIAGGALGYGLAKATDIDDTDVTDVKDREVVDEYRRQSDKLRRQKAIRDYVTARQRTGRVFL